jgi:hypothetical protein
MKGSRFTEEQIIGILKEGQDGGYMPAAQARILYRNHNNLGILKSCTMFQRN